MLKNYPRSLPAMISEHGDDLSMPNSDVPFAGDFNKSLPDFDRGNLKQGYADMGSIKSTSKSDEPNWA